MRKIGKRKGSALMLVIMIFLVVSSLSTLMIVSVDSTVFQVTTYAVMMQDSYLNQEALDIGIAALRDDDETLLKQIQTRTAGKGVPLSGGDGFTYYDPKMSYTVEHKYKDETGKEYNLGKTVLTLKGVKAAYNGNKNECWAMIEAVTTSKDSRIGRRDNSGSTKTTEYRGSVHVLCSDSVVQVYNTGSEKIDEKGKKKN